jgi:bifunctional non-homologous end joining protein LigD
MLSTLVDDPFDNPDWIFEIKWDGYRAIATARDGVADLRSRNDISFGDRYAVVNNALKAFPFNAVLDGEVVALDENGFSNFQYLQNWQSDEQGSLVYYVFDILWLDGYDLTQLPLIERKNILKQVLPAAEAVRFSDHVEENGKEFFEAAKQQGLEGIIAKNKNSEYVFNLRTKNWLKIKTTARQEAVIAGFTEPRASRQYFGALVLGVYEDGKLKYAGHTGSGFNTKTLKDAWNKLQPLITGENPFDVKPKTNMPVTWVKPKLVCEIKFQEWTKDNIMRQPIFMGLRTDKKPQEVKKEKSIDTEDVNEIKKPRARKTAATKKTASKTSSKPKTAETEWLGKSETEADVSIDGKKLKLTNLNKVYWKKEKYTKRDLLNYYHAIAPVMLPYMKNRPQSLNRHPNGIDSKNFFQKNVHGKVPGWIETFAEFSESTNETVYYFVCTSEASLIYMANLGCIEMNPWHSTTANPNNPDYCLIDLDPHEIGFDKVVESAIAVKKVLDELKIPGYPKTSGASGIHICIPLGAKYNYDQSKNLAELIANLVHQEIPSFTSVERNPSKRRKKVYLDFLQNRRIQTVACVYSARPKPGATVSTPIFWEELNKKLSPSNFTIKNIFERLKTEGDIFKPAYGKGIDLRKTLVSIEAVLQ